VHRRFALIVLSAYLTVGAVVFPSPSRGQAIEALPRGSIVDGLQLSLSATDSSTQNGLELQVAVRNAGDHDVTLNLGSTLANGKVQLPDNLSLIITDARGKTRTFTFADKKHTYVAGRMDDYLVPLRVGSIYTLTLTLDQFWCHETKEFEVKLLPGRNQITAQFEGGGAKRLNLDMSAIKLMNFWLGKVQSNALVIAR
jgi:hypothetical protein